MLSRANSNAGTRLRRAKSSSSVHHKSHDVQDPIVDPTHAGVAAVEAYRRAYNQSDPSHKLHSSSYPRKRQTQKSRSSEGSHFEESRSGKRIGVSATKVPSRSSSIKRPGASVRTDPTATFNDHEETIITRSRKAVNTVPVPPINRGRMNDFDVRGSTNHHIRKTKSACYGQSLAESQTRQPVAITPPIPYPDTCYQTMAERRESEPLGLPAFPSAESQKPTPQEAQSGETTRVAAWDTYLQDFHQRRLRGRKSFIAPIKKRLTRDPTPTEHVQFDASVPPYNFASESDDVFSSSPVPPFEANNSLQVEKLRTRTVSDGLKNKFKRLIGRSKRVQTFLPPQHIEAQYPHFGVGLQGDSQSADGADYTHTLPLKTSSPQSTTRTRKSSLKSTHSNGDVSTMKSRVTSWSNSTGAGTIRTSSQGGPLCSINETGMVTQPDTGDKQGHGSLFSRALRLSMRRSSRADLNLGSKDSQRLYDALCEQIQGPEEHTNSGTDSTINEGTIATETVIKEYLPPRVWRNASYERKAVFSTTSTIRSIQPEDQATGPSAPAVPNKAPSRPPPPPPLEVTREALWLRNSRQSLPSRKPLSESERSGSCSDEGGRLDTTVPSQAQIASRLGKSHNRWQSALEEQSPTNPRALRHVTDDEDPYRLRSITATPQDEYLPVAVRRGKRGPNMQCDEAPRIILPVTNIRDQVISPSIYSRRTDCRSVTPNEQSESHGTFITVTGREVKRYSLESPSKQLHGGSFVAKPSHEWKKWLDTELRDFDSSSAVEELILTGQIDSQSHSRTPNTVGHTTGHLRQSAERLNSGDTPSSSTADMLHGPAIHAPKVRRPVLSTRRSSMMNDRYPLLETGREPGSDRSLKTIRKPTPSSRQSSSTSRAVPTITFRSEALTDSGPTVTPTNAYTQIRKQHSSAALTASNQQSRQANTAAGDDTRSTTPKPKSALDLRAVYRHTNNAGSGSSISIRRKPMSVILQEDNTLRKISEGPYAQSSPMNKENTAPSRDASASAGGKAVYENDSSRAEKPQPTSTRSRSARVNITKPASKAEGGVEGKASPGQRMADDFLNSRKRTPGPDLPTGGGGSSPAFI